MSKILKIFRAEVKSVNQEDFTLEALVSTKKVDRDGDIVLPEAFDKRLKIYKDHPVLLSSHDYRDLRKQIGEAINIKSSDEGLLAKFKYYVGEGNPEADWAWVLAQKGIAAYSIGFIGHAFDWIEEKDEQGNKRITGRKFTDVELLEVSQVLVPSNRGALQLGVEPSAEELRECELALKSIEDKNIEIICLHCKKSFEKSHYIDNLLDSEAKAKSESKSEEISVNDITEAVRKAATA